MTAPTTDPVQQAADVITQVGEAHQAAITAWSHDTDPATARTPPPDLTSLDLAQALAAAGLIATETAPAGVIDREAIDVAIGGVLFNASNYPGPAQAYLWGRDIGPLRRKVVDAVLAILPGKTTAQVRAEALRDAAEALDALQTPEEGLPAAVRRDPALWLSIRADEEAGK